MFIAFKYFLKNNLFWQSNLRNHGIPRINETIDSIIISNSKRYMYNAINENLLQAQRIYWNFNKKLNVWKPKFCKQIIYDVWWIELRGTSSRKAPWKITHITFYQIFFKTINRSCQMTFSISKKNESKSKYLVKSSIILWTISTGLQ